MHLTQDDIPQLQRFYRANIINSITGVKPANLIGTISETGVTNVAIFSSVVHLGAAPPLVAFIARPVGEVPRNTFDNILQTGFYTINHVEESFVEKAHYTSAKFEESISEFEICQLTEEYIEGFKAPFVKESRMKMGVKLVQTIPIELNGTTMVIGEIIHAIVPNESVDTEGNLDLSTVNDIGISGLGSYYSLEKVAQFPYARPHQLPKFI